MNFQPAMKKALNALEASRLTIRIPSEEGARQRRAGLLFHATSELFFQQNGSTHFKMPHESFHLRAGEVCLMPRGVPHAEITSEPAKNFLTIITMFHQSSFSLHHGLSSPHRTVVSQPLNHFGAAAHLQIQRYLDEIVAARAAGVSIKDPQIRGLFLAALAVMTRALDFPSPEKAPLHTPLVSRCLALVEANLCEVHLNVKWLAGQLRCSADHLSRAFSRETRSSLISVIHEQRVKLAARLLDEQSLNAGEIAWASGFATQSYFNRVFLRHIGVPPRKYQALRGKAPKSSIHRSTDH
ncbi:hypothetical protein BH09VER1_BH09VER1_36100 [soil metagenome]